MTEKIYIKNFVEDLNYKPIILVVDEEIVDGDFWVKLIDKLKEDQVGHLFEFSHVILESKCFYIENCDIQACYYRSLLDDLLENKYKFYRLNHDEGGFYYEA